MEFKNKYNINNDLKDDGWISHETSIYAPVFDNPTCYLKISIKNNEKFSYQFVEKVEDSEGNNNFTALTTIYSTESPITESNTKRDSELGNYINNTDMSLGNDLKENKEITKKEIQNIGIKLLNADCLNEFKSAPSDIIESMEEEEKEEYPYKTFEDYPKKIQEEALEIIERGNIIDEMLDACNITHEGNRNELKALSLVEESLFIGEAVHYKIGGERGVGKTDIVLVSISIIPDHYVFVFKNPSPRFIHYWCENFNDDYNIIVNDDVSLNHQSTELNKSITDPNDKEKRHDTVIDGEPVTFKLPGDYLGIYNLAKDIEDNELLDRLFLGDITEDNDNKTKLKEKIKQNISTGIKNSAMLDSLKLRLKAVWQWHIDKNIKVFNPYTIFLNVEDKNNRNVASIVKLIKANSFFRYKEREKVNGVMIGNLDDLREVLELWEEKSLVQDYKLDPKQIEILKILKCHKKEEIDEIKHNFDLNPIETKEEVNTVSNISKSLGITYSTVSRLINGPKNGTQVGLEGMGLIKTFYLNDENTKAGKVIYINPEHKNDVERLKSGLDINHLNQTLEGYKFTSLNSKKKLVHNFLLFNQIIINDMDEYNINEFLENLTYEVDSYDKVVKLLKEIKKLLFDNFSEDNDFSEVSYDELSNTFAIYQNNNNFGEEKKTVENSLNDENTEKHNKLEEMDNVVKYNEDNEYH